MWKTNFYKPKFKEPSKLLTALNFLAWTYLLNLRTLLLAHYPPSLPPPLLLGPLGLGSCAPCRRSVRLAWCSAPGGVAGMVVLVESWPCFWPGSPPRAAAVYSLTHSLTLCSLDKLQQSSDTWMLMPLKESNNPPISKDPSSWGPKGPTNRGHGS